MSKPSDQTSSFVDISANEHRPGIQERVSPDKVRHVARYFPRHEVDKEAEGWSPGEDGYPSNGRIAWALWGGEPGKRWSSRLVERMTAADDGDKAGTSEVDMSKAQGEPQERKLFNIPVEATKVIDADEGIVEHLVTVFGVFDDGGDISHPGSFAKTLAERGGKIRVVDSHNYDSVLRVVGKPLMIKEIVREQLPPSVLSQYPEATGGLRARTQFLMNTPEGRGAFERIKEGAINEWSYGYDPMQADYSEVEIDGETHTARNLRQIRMWEYSPVLWGMNPATTVMAVKSKGGEAMYVCPECGYEIAASEIGEDWKCPKCGTVPHPNRGGLYCHTPTIHDSSP